MRTKLAIIAVSGLAVSAVCLGGAFAWAAMPSQRPSATLFGVDLTDLVDLPRCDSMAQPAPPPPAAACHGKAMTIAPSWRCPPTSITRPADGDQLVIQGAPEIIAHVRVHNGIVGFDCDGNFHLGKADRIDVVLPGRRTFRSFALLGTGDVRLNGLSQPDLKLSLGGSGNIQADGKTDELNVKISGSGNVKLGDLVAKRTTVQILGSGRAELAPQDSLDVESGGIRDDLSAQRAQADRNLDSWQRPYRPSRRSNPIATTP